MVAYDRCSFDKRSAVLGRYRVPEEQSLFWALIGGWLGAKLAQWRLRQKTRKDPFGSRLDRTAAVSVLMIGFLAALSRSGRLAELRLPDLGIQLTQFDGRTEAAAKPDLPRRFGPGS